MNQKEIRKFFDHTFRDGMKTIGTDMDQILPLESRFAKVEIGRIKM